MACYIHSFTLYQYNTNSVLRLNIWSALQNLRNRSQLQYLYGKSNEMLLLRTARCVTHHIRSIPSLKHASVSSIVILLEILFVLIDRLFWLPFILCWFSNCALPMQPKVYINSRWLRILVSQLPPHHTTHYRPSAQSTSTSYCTFGQWWSGARQQGQANSASTSISKKTAVSVRPRCSRRMGRDDWPPRTEKQPSARAGPPRWLGSALRSQALKRTTAVLPCAEANSTSLKRCSYTIAHQPPAPMT